MSERRPRHDHPAPLPGITRTRITGDNQAVAAVVQALAERFTTTDPAHYPVLTAGQHLFLNPQHR
ncbi:hypothetical protein [Kitasatospora sp. NPDC094016]|uniref:hypothetical protein n=1 Tax=Kitasatospora sp. NPDC094016 TaxID=3154986 RepID=UPI00331C779F